MSEFETAYYEDEEASDFPKRELLRRLFSLVSPHKKGLIFCLVLLLTGSGLLLLGPVLIKRAIDKDIASGDYGGLILTAVMYIVTQMVFLLVHFVQRVKLEIIGQKVMRKLRENLFSHLLKQPLSFFDANPVGRLLSRVESDTENLRRLFTNTVITMVGDALTFVGMFVVMFIVSWKLALITASVLPPIFIGARIFQKRTTKRFLMVRKRMADIMAFVTEHLQGMHVVQLFNQEERATERMTHANKRKFDTEFSAEFAVVVFFNILFFTELVGIALILWRGGLWAIQGVVTVGTLMMFIGYVRRFFQPIHHLSEQLSIFQKAFASSKRIFHLLDLEPVIDDTSKPVEWKKLEKGIEFRDVWFSYNEKDWALKGVSFNIPKGERWALVGQTGSGKTSIVNLLLRFYDCQKGSVEVDGLDVRNLRQKELRDKMALVLQDVFIFPGSVLENIRLGNEGIEPDRVGDALKTVCPEELMERLSDGLETELAERGKDLSTGERQLLSFARALAFDPEILLLDEATSSVDPATEAAIRDALSLLLEGRTSIIVAHRLSTVINSDKILVVHDGRIVEEGSHWELLRHGGHYSRLYELQLAQTCEAKEVREHG